MTTIAQPTLIAKKPQTSWLATALTRSGIVAIAGLGLALSLLTSFTLGGLVFTGMLLAMTGSSLMRYHDRLKDQADVDHWLDRLA